MAHLHHLNPLPRNTGEVVRSFPKVIVPEMNTGQLVKIIRSEFLVDAESITRWTAFRSSHRTSSRKCWRGSMTDSPNPNGSIGNGQRRCPR